MFQLSSEAVLIVDSNTSKIIEANPAALTLLGSNPKKLIGQAFESLFAESSRQASQSFLSATRVAPRVDNVHVQLERDQSSVLLTGSLYRQDGAPHLVVLLSRLGDGAGAMSNDDANILRLVEAIPEAFVVVDADRRVVTANAAFLDLVQVTSLVQVRGESFDRWIGRPGVEIDVLFSNLRAHGSRPPLFNCRARRIRHDRRCGNRRRLCRRRQPQPATASRSGRKDGEADAKSSAAANFPRTVEQFTELVGRVPMKNLVRETTDLIERLCIQAALELTRENRRSAAEMLGLSRQAFYVKLRRYGLGGDAPDDDEAQN